MSIGLLSLVLVLLGACCALMGGAGLAWRNTRQLDRRYRTLSATNQALLADRSADDLFDSMCQIAAHHGQFALILIWLPDSGPLFRSTHAAGPALDYSIGLEVSGDADHVKGQGPAGRAFRSGNPEFVEDFQSDPRTAPWAKRAATFGIRSSAAVPLQVAGTIFGVANFYDSRLGRFGPAEQSLVCQLAADMAVGIRHIQRRVELDRTVQRLAATEAASHAGSFQFENPGSAIWCSSGLGALLDCPAGEHARGAELAPILAELIDSVVEVEDGSGNFEFEWPAPGEGSGQRWFGVRGAKTVRPDGVQEYHGIIRDISEWKDLENAVLHATEEERNRMTAELHDNLGQILTGIKLFAASMDSALPEDRPRLIADHEQLNQYIQQAMDAYRAVVQAGALSLEHGLEAALVTLAKQVSATGIACTFTAEGPLPALSDEQALQLYRIAQESAHNAVRHARCKRIELTLRPDARGLALSITDDGIGFPDATPPRMGLGRRTMRHRASRIGARISFSNLKSGGACVAVRLRSLNSRRRAAARR